MLIFTYPEKTVAVETIEERLTALALAHQVRVDRQLPQPLLEDGTQTIEGEAAILQHLDEIEGELKHWWFCGC